MRRGEWRVSQPTTVSAAEGDSERNCLSNLPVPHPDDLPGALKIKPGPRKPKLQRNLLPDFHVCCRPERHASLADIDEASVDSAFGRSQSGRSEFRSGVVPRMARSLSAEPVCSSSIQYNEYLGFIGRRIQWRCLWLARQKEHTF